jgi:hypothetical protein
MSEDENEFERDDELVPPPIIKKGKKGGSPEEDGALISHAFDDIDVAEPVEPLEAAEGDDFDPESGDVDADAIAEAEDVEEPYDDRDLY